MVSSTPVRPLNPTIGSNAATAFHWERLLSIGHLQLCSFPFLLLAKHSPARLQHHLKPFPPPLRILPKLLHARLFYLRLNLLPSARQRSNPSLLLKHCPLMTWLAFTLIWLINHSLPNTYYIGPGEIRAAHGDALVGGVDVGCFIGVGRGTEAEDGGYPVRGGLGACY